MMNTNPPTEAHPIGEDRPSGVDEADLLGILEEIADALWRHREQLGLSLAGGSAGVALFFGHLSRLPGFERWRERSHQQLEAAIQALRPGAAPSLFGGYVGIAWTIEHLTREVFGRDSEDPNADVDAALLQLLEAGRWGRRLDLVSGITGIGLYALDRAERSSSRRILQHILTQLDALTTRDGRFRSWLTPAHLLSPWAAASSPEGHFDLGMAHGVPGILALLAGIHAAGIGHGLALRLYSEGMDWLRATLQDPEQGSYLTSWIPLHQERPPARAMRIAWCYGDLGASVALLGAGHLLGEQRDMALALDLARCAARRPLDQAGVVDVGLCHGSAGNAHLFHRLYLATGDPGFKAAAQSYFADVLKRRRPGAGCAGFLHYAPDDDVEEDGASHPDAYKATPGLLEGAAGVGLALMDLLDTREPTWDRLLQASPAEGLPSAILSAPGSAG